ncbi:hypothetical protein [Verrucomicrobium spinosum]|uniref:hypothetical protein n=1 Tax=Verrucomicrobium spinosum TaxID=2736 RepID=UPI0001745BFC|nr:hypothetical protein [Verrucomicrobium spinosum]
MNLAVKKRELLGPLIRAAVANAAEQPPATRADIYDGIAEITRACDPRLSGQARDYASALRESETLQLHFRNLFIERS